jgi:hypothetical protein
MSADANPHLRQSSTELMPYDIRLRLLANGLAEPGTDHIPARLR